MYIWNVWEGERVSDEKVDGLPDLDSDIKLHAMAPDGLFQFAAHSRDSVGPYVFID